jgi:hypothetical protein
MVDAVNSVGGYAAPVHIANNPADITSGAVWGRSVVHKFGSNTAIGTDIEDIWITGGIYTWLTAATTIEAISGSADDDAAGDGCRTITVQGLDADFAAVEEDITMAGTIATSATTAEFIRINRAFVKTAGAYASTSAGGNAGTITIRTSSGGATHCVIAHNTDLTTNFGLGQTQISRYTVPAGKTAYIESYQLSVETTKVVTFWLWQRQDTDTVTAPFSSRRLVKQFDGVIDNLVSSLRAPIGPFPAKTDLWWSGAASIGTARASVDFEIVQVDN